MPEERNTELTSIRVESIIKTVLLSIVGRKIECLAPWLGCVRKMGSHVTLQRDITQGI